TDSLGTVLNQKFYNGFGDLFILSILPLINGDILYTGYAEFQPFPVREDVYALRTDILLNAPPPISIISQNYTLPKVFNLDFYPNPFNINALIKYKISKTSHIKLSLYDLQGKEVKVLVNEYKNTGNYDLIFNAENLSSGVYYLVMFSSERIILTRKIVLIK
ncbi:MAG: T9SS type A sorting domain-containing protein, partial [Ignavibacteria bacterium]|nr:T9SS type A sorting domain-containing protein [Ignavibacteria bacterium]